MFISDKSDLEKLNFQPRGHCPIKVRFEWKNVVLNPQADESTPLVDLSDQDLNDVLIDLFGSISLIEAMELFSACQQHPALAQALSPATLMHDLGRQWNKKLQQLLSVLGKTPAAFLDWAHHRQLGPRELQPLVSLKDLQAASPLLEEFAKLHLSRNAGKQVLDLLVDLILLGHPPESLAPASQGSWLSQLEKQRKPMTLNNSKPSPPSPWPRYVQVVNFRQGDRMLKKMQITFQDQRDLAEKLQRLSKVETTHES